MQYAIFVIKMQFSFQVQCSRYDGTIGSHNMIVKISSLIKFYFIVSLMTAIKNTLSLIHDVLQRLIKAPKEIMTKSLQATKQCLLYSPSTPPHPLQTFEIQSKGKQSLHQHILSQVWQ